MVTIVADFSFLVAILGRIEGKLDALVGKLPGETTEREEPSR